MSSCFLETLNPFKAAKKAISWKSAVPLWRRGIRLGSAYAGRRQFVDNHFQPFHCFAISILRFPHLSLVTVVRLPKFFQIVFLPFPLLLLCGSLQEIWQSWGSTKYANKNTSRKVNGATISLAWRSWSHESHCLAESLEESLEEMLAKNSTGGAWLHHASKRKA